ncbi:MAG TPA: RNA 2',3'-cyclic phosphodiesterase [Chthoniobacterales bacterium]|nr:RNA 2',3'-cyclic phosphodiesterase [Chthoniobacterales bacterium]
MSTKRLFVAIDLPEPLQKILGELNPNIHNVRWTEPEQMHLTLGFFAKAPADADLTFRQKLETINFRAFFLPIIGVGAFPPKGLPKIIWIGVGRGHPHLFQIHKRVQEAALGAGLEPELHPWHPHITLARCREIDGGSVRRFLKSNADFEAGSIRVDRFHLYSSNLTPAGPIHTQELTIQSRN